MSRERGSRKRTEAILGRLLETYLPDEKQKISKRREKKSTSTRRSKRETRIRQKDAEERLDPEKKKKKAQEARKKNIETLKSWETEDEIQELKKRILAMKQEKEKLVDKAQVGLYESVNEEYFEKSRSKSDSKLKSWPGLTPGLAPVDYESDSE